jgi:hypothetical protein
MSYTLAVWEGPRPASDAEALETFDALMERHQGATPGQEPTPAIARYVGTLLERYPDITGDDGEDSPWADGPLMNNATGPLFYFAMVYSQAEDASEFAAAMASEQGLVCFDPQTGKLR